MRIAIVKGKGQDHITIRRADGSTATTCFSHKGPFPHDAVHFAVERQLRLQYGFWGLIAKGTHPDEIAEMAKAAGHASAKRADAPAPHIIELLQAERLVECFEADLWGGGGDPSSLKHMAKVACESSQVSAPEICDTDIAAIRADIAAMTASWREGRLDLEWQSAT